MTHGATASANNRVRRYVRELNQALADVAELKELAKLLLHGHIYNDVRPGAEPCEKCSRSQYLRAKHKVSG